MKTRKYTVAQAIIQYLCNQYIEIEGKKVQLFAGVFGIFGHGNVTCLGEALHQVRDILPTWRGQNEQSMALAAVAFAKAKRRKQIMIVTSSIGPGAANIVTAAATAHVNRLPLLILSGEVFQNRCPDPVLQQLEHFDNPTTTVNDSFRAVTRYWDKISHPEQILSSLPQAVATMLDPASCGPAFLGLCQDTQEIAFNYPFSFFQPKLHHIPKPRPDVQQIQEAVQIIQAAKRPFIIAGGGVRYASAEKMLMQFAEKYGIPISETIAGRGVLLHNYSHNIGSIGVVGSTSANYLAGKADVILSIGTRLQDFTTGSSTVFHPDAKIISINTARFDAYKYRSLPIICDAEEGLKELNTALESWKVDFQWLSEGQSEYKKWQNIVEETISFTDDELPSYAQVIGCVNKICDDTDLALTAAGGFPAELSKNWRVKSIDTFDCEFGFSCMGYEIAGGLGARMANKNRDVIVFCGDGSYLMHNSEIHSSVITGHKMIIIVCDNGGYAVINRLQNFKGSPSFNNLFKDCKHEILVEVDFTKHAQSMGAYARTVSSLQELEKAFRWSKTTDRTTVISIKIDPHKWSTSGDAWWDVGVPEVSTNSKVNEAYQEHIEGREKRFRK